MEKTESKLLLLIRKEINVIYICLAASFALFVLYALFFYTPLYKTTAKVFVKNIQKQDVITSYNSSGGSVSSESGYSNPLFNLYDVLESQNVSDTTYSKVKAKYPKDIRRLNVKSKSAFYDVYDRLISANVIPSTDILEITLLWPSKKHSQPVLKDVISNFKEENLNIRRSVETKKRIFLDEQTEEISQKLEDIRSQLKDYKAKAQITDIPDETQNLIAARVDLEKQAAILESQISYNKQKLSTFSSQLNIKSPEIALRATGIGSDPYLIKLSQELAISQQKLANLKAKFKDNFPDVISVKNEIASIQKNIDKRKAETSRNVQLPRAIYDNPSSEIVTNFALAQAESVSMQSQLKQIRAGIAQMKAKEAEIPTKELGLDDLEKQEAAFLTAYSSIKEKQLEAKIKESEIVDNLIVLTAPSTPIPLKFVLLGRFVGFLLGGFLCGLIFAYVKQGLEDKWMNINEIRLTTGQDVLGSIPWLVNIKASNAKLILDAAFSNIASEIISKAYIKESFILSFLSTNRLKNKAFIVETIAAKLTRLGRSVLLIDIAQRDSKGLDLIDAIGAINKDLRFLYYDNTQGHAFVDYNDLDIFVKSKIQEHINSVVRKQNVLLNDENIELNVIETNKSNNINDSLASRGFGFMLKNLKQNYEFIFINTPHGMVLLPEIQTIKKISDATVIIASIESNREGLIDVVNNITASGDKILGVIAREENSELERYFNDLEGSDIDRKSTDNI